MNRNDEGEVSEDAHHTLITGIHPYTSNTEMTVMRLSRCLTLSFALLLSPLLFIVIAADATDVAAKPAPHGGAWFLLIVIGVIAIVVAAGLLVFALRLVKASGEGLKALIDALRALTQIPVVTLADEILDGTEGQLEVRITGFSSPPLGQVTVVLVPPPGFTLEQDHITLPFADAGETKSVWIGHSPVLKGMYLIGVTVPYRVGEEERVREFTRTVCAGIPAKLKPID